VPDIPENWFFECRKHIPLTAPRNGTERFALASSVAERIYRIIIHPRPPTDVNMLDEPTYPSDELFRKMKILCDGADHHRHSPLVDMLDSAIHLPPLEDRVITLSIVTILPDVTRIVERFQRNLDIISLYLQSFPQLPFEIVVCFGRNTESDRPFEKLVTIPTALRGIVRVIPLPRGFASEFHSPVFPEYIARNVGIRRSRGEFILSCSSDVVPHISLFEAVLHRQFTQFTLLRPLESMLRLIEHLICIIHS
jgi:hypothetical protein